jgi:predicted house-cleaning noncanonical NTP pyrophosphatase (MazG superfamily)
LLKAIDTDDNEDILEESADVVEVIHSLLLIRNMSFEDLKKTRSDKNKLKGAFNKFYVLKKV